ncbi:MAG: cation-translocating P-type ATPase [Planctomycetaceae bacterium]|nr:cation-translocating P-type ATPase [Planctomycetaceae bacterium]
MANEIKPWYCLNVQEALTGQGSAKEGLTDAQAREKLESEGPNELVEQRQRKALKIFLEQITSTMEIILIVASVISIALGSVRDSVAILAIVILFAVLGFVQDYRAEKAMAALKKMAVPFVRVKRGGHTREISVKQLVRGDIIFLETGNIVPADCRLIGTSNLKIQESALTGEAEPDDKNASALEAADTPLGDRTNMAYMGTVVTMGRAEAVVTETGMRTELGKIASIIQGVGQQLTPLQKRLDYLGKILAVIGIAISLLIIVIGLLRGESLTQLLLAGISVAVAVIPEGLPAVVTITLAIGSHRMLQRHALIRKLPAVETLGSVTVICSDKTGTLTQNRMSVVHLNVVSELVQFQVSDNQIVNLSEELKSGSLFTVMASALCNDTKLSQSEKKSILIGDPTETAMVAAAQELGLDKDQLEHKWPRAAEIPFDSNRKRMTTIHQLAPEDRQSLFPFLDDVLYVSLTKGSVDGLLEISDKVLIHNKVVALDPEIKKSILNSNERLAAKGIRVIGVAFSTADKIDPHDMERFERNLTYVGSLGMVDPPRPEVKQSVQICKDAGIRTVMITGDHPLTAKYIASELGMLGQGRVLTGSELEKISADELKTFVNDVSIYARVSPEHKLKIVDALQENGHIVAMTGDGVNDAPALKKANIGVAMGITGTDVSKDASDIVLTDDNFASIVNAVQEGRIIYDNIKKFVKFSVGGNIGKVIVMLAGPLMGESLPLIPLQLLWLNLLTDGLLGLGLGLESSEGNVMVRSPIDPKENIFARGGWLQVTVTGLLIGLVSLLLGGLYLRAGSEKWQTMIFAAIAFAQAWQVLSVRSSTDLLIRIGIFSNRTLISMVALTVILQLFAIYSPFLQQFLRTQPLNLLDMAICIGAGSIVFVALEIEKTIRMSVRGPKEA